MKYIILWLNQAFLDILITIGIPFLNTYGYYIICNNISRIWELLSWWPDLLCMLYLRIYFKIWITSRQILNISIISRLLQYSFWVKVGNKAFGVSLSIVFIFPLATGIVKEGWNPVNRVILNLTGFSLFVAVNGGKEYVAIQLFCGTGKSFSWLDAVRTSCKVEEQQWWQISANFMHFCKFAILQI